MLKLYNTLTKSKEKFLPIHKGKVSIYTCGPTVYDYIHIGNIRAYLTADILRRYLEYSGYEVRHIKNITDVGHLTDDDIAQGDTGEDKILKKALAEKKTPTEITKFFEESFRSDEKEMNILPAHYFPRATAHVPQMIKMIENLIEKGHAYEKNGNVFYDVTSFPDYGKLSGNTLENLKVGARLEQHPDKKHPWDFALWLKADPNHILQWDSPWSRGYPGWHIECSAMSIEYLGNTIDIHSGAEDNIFPHHEAEIVQSEGATGKKFVHYWIHLRHLLVDGAKMSKSKGNFYRLQDIKDKKFDPMHLRLLFLSSHYRKNVDFSWLALKQAKVNYERIAEWIKKLQEVVAFRDPTPKSDLGDLGVGSLKMFASAMNDDLNTPLSLSYLYELITETNKQISENNLSADVAKKILANFEKMNKVFGLTFSEKETNIPEEVSALADARQETRKNKDFQKSDELRKEIEKMGYLIEDLGDSYKLKKK
ncbi:MAG: cysteine--tRNA ligase [Parcubacteria group bacterium]|jgi:cysteinyl-tRNA synthetase